LRGFVEFGGGVTGGILPRPSGYVLVEAGLAGRRWQVALRGDYVTPRRIESRQVAGAGGILSALGGAALAGPVFALGPTRLGLELPLQFGIWGGILRARGFGTDRDVTRSVGSVAVVADAGLRWSPVARISLGVRAELVIALLRHTFTLGAPFVVARTGVAAGRGALTFAVRFP
jgi:hypothetical protein